MLQSARVLLYLLPNQFTLADLTTLKHSRLWYGVAYAALTLVAVVSLMPAPPQVAASDKLLHFVTYAVLSAIFSSLACKHTSLLKIAPALIIYGIVIEILQGLSGYRYMEFYDMLANSAGVLSGLLIRLTPLPYWFRHIEQRWL